MAINWSKALGEVVSVAVGVAVAVAVMVAVAPAFRSRKAMTDYERGMMAGTLACLAAVEAQAGGPVPGIGYQGGLVK